MSTNDIAIKVDNVSKVYRLGARENAEDSLVEAVGRMIRSPIKNYKKYHSLYDFSDLDFDNPDINPDRFQLDFFLTSWMIIIDPQADNPEEN